MCFVGWFWRRVTSRGSLCVYLGGLVCWFVWFLRCLVSELFGFGTGVLGVWVIWSGVLALVGVCRMFL